ncbi:VRR-NUC domain containing protein [uncultured Caudovirales phage]|uniref:VRR-NUC domain containing protein n=1 Tax=uncultured Caudovirales phage TaxID=2100421 RepID=A0A6J5MBV6_9CAUD|nr:VRR-NUC domain containing protein [uncultured Caudovirales phage]
MPASTATSRSPTAARASTDVARHALESKAEQKFVDKAKLLKWKVRKLNGLGQRDWPDRLVVAPATVCFVEFKRVGEDPRPTQEIMIEELRAQGADVGVFDDADEAVQWVQSLIDRNAKCLSGTRTPTRRKRSGLA